MPLRLWLKRKRIWAALATIVVALILGAYYLLLPVVVERRLIAAIKAQGIPDVSLRVENVSLGSLHLRQVYAADLAISDVYISYSLAQLYRGEVDTIHAENVQPRWRYQISGDQIGPAFHNETLTRWLAGRPAAPPATTLPRLPFRHLTVSGQVRLDTPLGESRWPYDLTISQASSDPNQLAGTLVAYALPAPLQLNLSYVSGDWHVLLQPQQTHLREDWPGLVWAGRYAASTGGFEFRPQQPSINFKLPPDGRISAWLHQQLPALSANPAWIIELEPVLKIAPSQDKTGSTSWQPSLAMAWKLTPQFSDNLHLSALDMTLAKPAAHIAGQLLLTPQGLRLSDISADLKWEKAALPPLEFSASRVHLAGAVNWNWPDSPQVALRLQTDAFGCNIPDASASIQNIRLDLPITFGQNPASEQPLLPPGLPGQLTLTGMTVLNQPLADLAIAIGLHEGKLTFESPWADAKTAAASSRATPFVKGDLNLLAPSGPAGEIKASLLNFNIADPHLLAARFPELTGMELTGNLEAHAVLQAQPGRWNPWVTLYLRSGRAASSALELEAAGLEAQVDFHQFSPLATPPFQWITAQQARVGKLNLRDGLVQFQMQTPHSILVERTRWAMGDTGRFWVHGFWMDPAADKIDLEVFLEDVNIKDILGLTAEGSVRGDGLIYGRIPITILPDAVPPVHLGQGFLYARPDPGWFQVQDRRMLEGMLTQGETGVDQQIKQRFVDALADFQYSMLKLEFVPTPAGFTPQHAPGVPAQPPVTLKITIAGKGRQGEHPLEFSKLTININGIEDLLDLILRIKRERDHANQLPSN